MTAQQTYAHDLTIRGLAAADDTAVRRLVELEGRAAPAGSLLGAFLDDRLLAVLPATGGDGLADPFVASAEALDLLALRAAQMRGETGGSRLRRLGGLRRTRSHGMAAG